MHLYSPTVWLNIWYQRETWLWCASVAVDLTIGCDKWAQLHWIRWNALTKLWGSDDASQGLKWVTSSPKVGWQKHWSHSDLFRCFYILKIPSLVLTKATWKTLQTGCCAEIIRVRNGHPGPVGSFWSFEDLKGRKLDVASAVKDTQ